MRNHNFVGSQSRGQEPPEEPLGARGAGNTGNTYAVSIGPGCTISAMAIGANATASGRIPGGTPQPARAERVDVSVDLAGVTPEHAARILQGMAFKLRSGITKPESHASTTPDGRVAWSIAPSRT